MARKRNYKAEYAAAKARAKAAGYSTEREYKHARKSAAIPKGAKATPLHKRTVARMYPNGMPSAYDAKRAACKAWSDVHSNSIRSRFNESWPDERVEKYYQAYVAPPEGDSRRKRKRDKMRRLKAWLVPEWLGESEWEHLYV